MFARDAVLDPFWLVLVLAWSVPEAPTLCSDQDQGALLDDPSVGGHLNWLLCLGELPTQGALRCVTVT